jgi:hypothetical protein
MPEKFLPRWAKSRKRLSPSHGQNSIVLKLIFTTVHVQRTNDRIIERTGGLEAEKTAFLSVNYES